MSANSYTTADLINDVTLLGHVPLGNNTLTNANIVRLGTLEIQTTIMKQIMSTRGNYYLTYQDFEANSDGLYAIPGDAIAGALANVEMVQEPTIIPVNLIEESEQLSTNSPTSTGYGFFPKGNNIQILPTPPIGKVRLWYFKRTSDLVLVSQAAQVIAVNGSVITVSSLPSTMTVGVTLDVCGDQPPFNILGTREITNIDGTDVTLNAEVDDMEIGDWLALEGQTPIPQIPVEYRLVLAQTLVCKNYEMQGYLEKLAAAQKKLDKYIEDTQTLITPRVQSQSKVINAVLGGFIGGNLNRMTNFPAGRS